MISPAESLDPGLVPQLNSSQMGKEKVLFMREAESVSGGKGESVINEKGSWPAHCWEQVSQTILAIQGVCKENR